MRGHNFAVDGEEPVVGSVHSRSLNVAKEGAVPDLHPERFLSAKEIKMVRKGHRE